ncbi:alanine racemase [Demetria terragena]|uniref:alanine racemase n=1 Tax=Demetria terragena TaxID=63959 RepID=UPI0003A5C016|nr:alanine racemase [Demetria terragena]
MSVQRPAWVTVDLEAISSNVARLKDCAPGAQVMAVVKGDAYGHGLVPSARAALKGGATWLGMAQMAEALALRAAGISAPLLTWLHVPGTDFDPAIREGIDLGIPAVWELDEVARAARQIGITARVHLKADTGMGRNGAYGADWDELVTAAVRAEAEGSIRVVGLFTHLACADVPDHPSLPAQEQVFTECVRRAEAAGLKPEVRHMANSAATLTRPSAAWDLVRPGLSIYGLSPAPEVGDAEHFGLRPAMRVEADLTVVKRVPAGQGVSYGHTYVTNQESTLVDVPMGYADGIFRHASGTGPVQIGGQRFTVAGRVCMDQFVVDVGDLEVAAGDRVVLFGSGEGGEPTAQDWADAAGTISYEIVTRMSGRLPRTYLGEECVS